MSSGDSAVFASPRDGAVHGVRGLHVIDASVMPCAPRGQYQPAH
ncbi:GMC oxidoreductase, partial [Cupriavidus sp. 2MCAB6]